MSTSLDKMRNALDRASKNSILREMEIKRKYAPDLAAVDEQERIANKSRHTIVKLRDVNKAPFVQILTDNVNTLLSKKLLSSAELSLMHRMSCLVAPKSNEIIVNGQERKIPTNEEIANALGYGERQYRTLVHSLLEKGIIYEIVDAEEIRQFGRVTKERMLLMNPELFIASNRNHIEVTLSSIHIMCEKLERKHKILLPWKIWYVDSHEYGKLYKRKTYLEKKKQVKENSTQKCIK